MKYNRGYNMQNQPQHPQRINATNPNNNHNATLPSFVDLLRNPGLQYQSMSDEEREQIRVEFYKTYDVAVGLRTAATLSCIILFFLVLILYKMKCRPKHKIVIPEEITEDLLFADITEAERLKEMAINVDRFVNCIGSDPFKNDHRFSLQPKHSISSYGSSVRGATRKNVSSACAVLGYSHDSGAVGGVSPAHSGSVAFNVASPSSPSSLGVEGGTFFVVETSTAATIPTLRLLEDSHHQHSSCSFDKNAQIFKNSLLNPIDIHIIQPTPNVSPCGSERGIDECSGDCDNLCTQHQCNKKLSKSTENLSDQLNNDAVPQRNRSSSLGNNPSCSINRVDNNNSLKETHRNSLNNSEELMSSLGSDSVFFEEDSNTDLEVDDLSLNKEGDGGPQQLRVSRISEKSKKTKRTNRKSKKQSAPVVKNNVEETKC